jgi:spore coat protein A, manganese oxidase
MDRRRLLQLTAAAGGALLARGGWSPRAAFGETSLLNPLSQPRFVNPLPNPLDPRFIYAPTVGTDGYAVGAFAFLQHLGLYHPGNGAPLETPVWGYGGLAQQGGLPFATYPGRTFVAQRNAPVTVQWSNHLFGASHLLPVDTTLHWANPLAAPLGDPFNGPIPIVPHLHGGHTESDSDGLPEYWWTPGEAIKGPRFVKTLYFYDNDQPAGTLWYHDHALGITRLNVYAGLAGFYILRDDVDTGSPGNPLGLPANDPLRPGGPVFYEIPIVIQDRLFTAEGQLFYPTEPDELEPGYPAPPSPSVLPEFFGNIILVNGQAWPVLDVEPRKYRFRLLNGSDSRFYRSRITPGDATGFRSGPQFNVIGTDDALLPRPVPVDQLTIGPGERYDVIVDFAGFEGHTLVVRNNARSPFPKGHTVDPLSDGQILAFRVGSSITVPESPLSPTLAPAIVPPGPVATTRRLLLFEGVDRFGRLQPLLGTVKETGAADDGTQLWADPITETIGLGNVEIWEVFNATADAHPIHLHLVSFLILSRQKFKAEVVEKIHVDMEGHQTLGGRLQNVTVIGQPRPPELYEAGWKDTGIMYPGEVTRITARFDRPGRYVWHCHILSHEDHEMMRPYYVS